MIKQAALVATQHRDMKAAGSAYTPRAVAPPAGQNVTLVYTIYNTGNVVVRNLSVLAPGLGQLICMQEGSSIGVDGQVQCRYAAVAPLSAAAALVHTTEAFSSMHGSALLSTATTGCTPCCLASCCMCVLAQCEVAAPLQPQYVSQGGAGV
jgi:hypothetical protein